MADDFSEYGLGRLHAPDPKDNTFLMRATVFPQAALMPPKPRVRPYTLGATQYQGEFPRCVGYSSRHKLTAAPFMVPDSQGLTALDIYQEAQKRDEWPGEDYDGTSVRGAFKYLQEKGYIKSYVWAASVTDCERFIRDGYGTMVLGTIWKNSMFRPRADGFLTVEHTSLSAGGHAYHLFWMDPDKREAWCQNSWERWGIVLNRQPSCFKLRYDDLDWLLSNDGEAGAGIEVKVK